MLYLLLLLSFLTGVAFALRRRRRSRMTVPRPLDWLDQFSTATYQPMKRLLGTQDYRVLESLPGYEPRIARRLRRQRVGIFQSYLRAMIWDFHRLLNAAQYITLCSPGNQSALAGALWRFRVRFYASVIAAECRVPFHLFVVGGV